MQKNPLEKAVFCGMMGMQKRVYYDKKVISPFRIFFSFDGQKWPNHSHGLSRDVWCGYLSVRFLYSKNEKAVPIEANCQVLWLFRYYHLWNQGNFRLFQDRFYTWEHYRLQILHIRVLWFVSFYPVIQKKLQHLSVVYRFHKRVLSRQSYPANRDYAPYKILSWSKATDSFLTDFSPPFQTYFFQSAKFFFCGFCAGITKGCWECRVFILLLYAQFSTCNPYA